MGLRLPWSYQRIIIYSKYHETFFHDLYYRKEENHKSFKISKFQMTTNQL
jgi:hypothetical protein